MRSSASVVRLPKAAKGIAIVRDVRPYGFDEERPPQAGTREEKRAAAEAAPSMDARLAAAREEGRKEGLREGHARVRMDEVTQHLDRTWFAWIGGTAPDSVFYYRIHSPVILIEFDHQRPANLRHLAKNPDVPNREHIHVVVRTPNGNDYGKDLLRQHYVRHPHTAPR